MPLPVFVATAAKAAAQRQAARAAVKTTRKLKPVIIAGLIILFVALATLAGTFTSPTQNTAVSSATSAISVMALAQNNAKGKGAPVAPADYSCGVNTGVVAANGYAMPKGPPSQYDALFARAAAETPVSFDSTLLKAQAIAESGLRPNATSGVAFGLIQFTRGTWAVHGIDGDGDGRADILNPVDNVMSSAAYTAKLRKIVAGIPGDPIDLTLAAYNAGPGNVTKYNGVPPFSETRGYIARIRKNVASWGSALNTSTAVCAQSVGVSGDWAKPIARCVKTSAYGPRGAVRGVHGARFHAGQDCGAPIGTPLFAAHGGTLTQKNDPGGYGTYYSLDAGNGITLIYGHMSKLELPSGTVVKAGQRIGLSGNTGGSSGPHLHFEVRVNNKPANPVEFMNQQRIEL